ncbi:hypothetical protein FIBSPDRAFT_843788 [Athelia psychrophila]|uniref:Uncharacterized protein n=1 Tax=Athelia psychrophila TaxID=1759441 RepID=A0A167V2C9_9AGAM|nr:hypothetical protein FIBSPDRAFT_843788 [Fibularhizoctonia sp. CBS 109695]
MIPLIPTLVLAFISFIASVYVILRIVIPILPPSPLSRRVPPSEFGLPNFRTLSTADKSHLWLAGCDILALSMFLWQAITEEMGGPTGFTASHDAGSAVRLWLAMTARQTCLMVVACVTLLHVRMGRSVTLGALHWVIWAPTLLLVATSTAVAGVLAGTDVSTFFIGLVGYSTGVAIFTTAAFAWLVVTLVTIKRNLAALNGPADNWPPVREVEAKPRPSFATEDIDAMREGSSWITSNASVSSHHDSVDNWSFSTHANHVSRPGSARLHPGAASHPSIPGKSAFWFNGKNSTPSTPFTPPMPSPYRTSVSTTILGNDPDPFRRDTPSPHPSSANSVSGGSWLTSPSASQATISQWSYPTAANHEQSCHDLHADLLPSHSRPSTPAMANAHVLGGYGAGYAPGSVEAEQGLASLSMEGNAIDVSPYRALGWVFMVWLPLGLSLPYFFMVNSPATSLPLSVMLSVSVMISSPLLALSLIFGSPMPIPAGLFEIRSGPSSSVTVATTRKSSDTYVRDYKRSGSVTVVEGRRSGDVWLTNGDAKEGKNKFGRVVGMLQPAPKLSVLPSEVYDMGEMTPPLPMQMEDEFSSRMEPSHQSQNSAELGQMRSSYSSVGDESMAYASRIMVAQKHYSTLAQTVMVAASPDKDTTVIGSATGAAFNQRSKGHMRNRSSMSRSPRSQAMPSPPPSFPLPPTPPTLKNSRLARMGHKKAFSSGNLSLSAINDVNEIDAMTAGLLPGLVPGLKVREDMKIREDVSPAGTLSKASKIRVSPEFGGMASIDFSPPEESTPVTKRDARARQISHKKNHYSLPSLGLGKDGAIIGTWKVELNRALESKVGKYATISAGDLGRRTTVWGGEAIRKMTISTTTLVQETDAHAKGHAALARSKSTRNLGLRADVPVGIDSFRDSTVSFMSAKILPPSAASTITLFEFEAGLSGTPLAESTPPDQLKKNQFGSKKPAPRNPLPTPRATRRSSIVYIISSENDSATSDTNLTNTPRSAFTRAVRQLVPKKSILQRKPSTSESQSVSPPSGGLRPLSLLQDRDTNRQVASPGAGTRPLLLGKKKLQLKTIPDDDENVDPSSRKNKNVKQLQLARSETSRHRGALRANEVLPNVVVRPPSTAESEFVYGYAC